MKFSVSSADLLKQLQIASGAIGSNPVLPILEDFLFDITKDKLHISSTNLETSIETSMEVQSDSDGQIALPARILLDTLKALPEQPITFQINEETNGVEITSAYGKYRLAGDPAEDFPTIPDTEDQQKIDLDAELLLKALGKTLFATSNDELRLAMTGVLVQVDFNKAIFVATDAHKLVKYTFLNLSSDQSASFIIPKRALTLLKNALPSEGKVEMAFNKSNAFFTFGDDCRVVCRLIDARYPDYNAVIPTDNPHDLLVERAAFQSSLKRIAIYANKTTNQVVLNLNEGSLTISAQDLDFSNEANEQLSCTYNGEPMSIGFNAKFLIEMLGVLDTKDIKMELSTPNRAGIVVPTEKIEGEELIMLVMPVMMSN